MEGLEATGVSVKALQNRPILYSWMVPYVRAFEVLSSSRTIGMSLNPISLRDIEAYIRLYAVEDDREFVALVQRMDQAYLMKMNKD